MNFGKIMSSIGKFAGEQGDNVMNSRIMNSEAMQGLGQASQGVAKAGRGIGEAASGAADQSIQMLKKSIISHKVEKMLGQKIPEAMPNGTKVNKEEYISNVFRSMPQEQQARLMQEVNADLDKYLGVAKDTGMVAGGGMAGAYMAE